MTRIADGHAVVLGAGISGLLAARAISGHFAQVTVLDRDPMPGGPDARRGVPQGRHIHGMQARGVQILDDLFPGLTDELVAQGASRIDDLAGLHFRVGGSLLCQQPKHIAPVLLASRPYFEHELRRRLEGLDPVCLFGETDVERLLWTRGADGRTTVTGVRIASRDGTVAQDLPADLVVDATGRGSRAPVWLSEMGYPRPAEERIVVRVKYASQTVRMPADLPRRFVIEGRAPGRTFGVGLFGGERDTWVFSVMGSERAFPAAPTREWMLALADELLPDWAARALRTSEPLTAISTHQHPVSVRRRYDRLPALPAGLVVTGDAVCAFNPVYGQGMSVAAEQAHALRKALESSRTDVFARVLARCAPMMSTAWDLAAGSDLAFPDVEGEPTRAMRYAGRYVQRVLRVAETDPEVARRFMAVSGLIKPRTALFAPRVLVPVLRDLRRDAGAPAPAVPAATSVGYAPSR